MLKEQLKINEWLELIKEDKNLNGAYICISQYLYLDEKETQELKKQLDKANDELYTLKNKYNIRLLNQISENIEPDCEDYYLAEIETKANKYDLIQTQQKEFIKYLEDDLKEKYRDMGYRHNIFREILDKYEEIIGDDK